MNYVVKKFKHDLLGNNFTFFMDHEVLLYLVHKPIVTSRIAKWLLLLQEFDFKVIFKPGQVHFLPDQLFIINHGKLVIGAEDQLFDTQLFGIEIEWYGHIIDYLKKGYLTIICPKNNETNG